MKELDKKNKNLTPKISNSSCIILQEQSQNRSASPNADKSFSKFAGKQANAIKILQQTQREARNSQLSRYSKQLPEHMRQRTLNNSSKMNSGSVSPESPHRSTSIKEVQRFNQTSRQSVKISPKPKPMQNLKVIASNIINKPLKR
jgi:hypothetical protein